MILRHYSYLMLMLWGTLLFDVVPRTTANLFHIPGVRVSQQQQQQGDSDVNHELYKVCSVAEDDTREDVMNVVEDGADIDWVHPQEGSTCLFVAVQRGKLAVVETMLELGADVTIPRREDGLTVWQAAVRYGRTHELTALLKHLDEGDRDVDMQFYGVPLLHEACQHGFSAQHKRVLSYLVEQQGADINQVDWLGRTCLDNAVETGRRNLIFHIEDLGGKRANDLVPPVVAAAI